MKRQNRQPFKKEILCALHKIFLFALALLFSSFHPAVVLAQTDAEDHLQTLLAKLVSIEEQLRRIETDNQKIRARQEDIMVELNRIRVWVRRQ